MRARRPRALWPRARGQSIVEASLGMLVMVSVIVLTVHLAEVQAVSLKLPKLAHAVLFDATGHSLSHGGAAPTVSQLNARVPRQAADLDLRTSTLGGAAYRGLFTQAAPLGPVAAAHLARVDRPAECSYPANDPYATVPSSLDSGWMLDVAPALAVTSLRMPRGFLEGSQGFFREHLLTRSSYALCSLGRRTAAGCQGSYKILLDDRALHYDSPTEPWDRVDCALYGCANDAFKGGGMGRFGSGTGAASTMARAIIGSSPIDETEYWHSFRDARSAFTENGFKTGPGPATRTACWLGMDCP